MRYPTSALIFGLAPTSLIRLRRVAYPAIVTLVALGGCKSSRDPSALTDVMTAVVPMRTPPFPTYIIRHVNAPTPLTQPQAVSGIQKSIDQSKWQFMQPKVGGGAGKAAGEGEYFGADLFFYLNKYQGPKEYTAFIVAPVHPNREVLRLGFDYQDPGLEASLAIRSGAKALLYPYSLRSYLPAPDERDMPWRYSVVIRDMAILDAPNILVYNRQTYHDAGDGVPVMDEAKTFTDGAALVNQHMEAFAGIADVYVRYSAWSPVESTGESLLYLASMHYPHSLYNAVTPTGEAFNANAQTIMQEQLAPLFKKDPVNERLPDALIALAKERRWIAPESTQVTLAEFTAEVMATLQRLQPQMIAALESHYRLFNQVMALNMAQSMATWQVGPVLSEDELRRAQAELRKKTPASEEASAEAADDRSAGEEHGSEEKSQITTPKASRGR